MLDRLSALEDRYEKLNDLLADPAIIKDTNQLREVSKEQSQLAPTVEVYRVYRDKMEAYQEARHMLTDPEMRDLAKEEVAILEPEIKDLETKLKALLLPKDPNDDKNVIVEIRGAAGGDEAALFAGDLV